MPRLEEAMATKYNVCEGENRGPDEERRKTRTASSGPFKFIGVVAHGVSRQSGLSQARQANAEPPSDNG